MKLKPFEFEKFNTTYMGNGEGTQYEGWGTYFSTSQDVAEYYAHIKGRGTLYRVEIPPKSKFLLWHQSLILQPRILPLSQKIKIPYRVALRIDGMTFYKKLALYLGSSKQASLWLLDKGIQGIQYNQEPFDITNKGPIPSGVKNFVIFDPNQLLVKSPNN